MGYTILFLCHVIPVVHYAIHVAHHELKTVTIMAKILEQFQDSVVRLYQD